MNQNRAATLAYIDEDEGPELNISDGEPGGSSCHGVTMQLLQEYDKAHGLPAPTLDDMRAMTSALAGTIYSWQFLDPLRFDDLPAGVDYRTADAAVSLGGTGACLVLQMALETYPFTGVMDDATVRAAQTADPRVLIAALDAAWLAWKHGLGADGWTKFNHGWLNRVVKVHARAIAMLGVPE
jgi:lysozyme family protein